MWMEETSELPGCAVRASGLWNRRQDLLGWQLLVWSMASEPWYGISES